MAKQISRILCTLLLAAAVTPAAQAQFLDSGFYFEVAMGKATFKDVDLAEMDEVAAGFFFPVPYDVQSSALEDKDRSYALISGYHINPYFAVEGGFFRLGAAQYTSAGTLSDETTVVPASFNFSFRSKGFMFGGTATLPVGSTVELRARAGFSTNETRIKVAYSAEGESDKFKFSENSQDLYYGAGVGVKVWSYYRLGIDWMRHVDVGNSNTVITSDVDNIMLSFGYSY